MSVANGLPRFERLLLALGGAGGQVSVEFAARLAALFQIPLEALYIEDEELLAVASLPFTRETSRLGTRVPGFEPARLERELRRQASRLEQLARLSLAGRNVQCHFSVVRGKTALTLTGALRPRDLLVLSRELGPVSGPGRISSAVLAALAGGWSALLLLDESAPTSRGPVTTWFDRSPQSMLALRLAQRLALAQERRLSILLPAGLTPDELLLLPGVRARGGPEIRILRPDADPLEQIAAARSGLMVLPEQPLTLVGARLEGLLRRARAPLLLLRNTD